MNKIFECEREECGGVARGGARNFDRRETEQLRDRTTRYRYVGRFVACAKSRTEAGRVALEHEAIERHRLHELLKLLATDNRRRNGKVKRDFNIGDSVLSKLCLAIKRMHQNGGSAFAVESGETLTNKVNCMMAGRSGVDIERQVMFDSDGNLSVEGGMLGGANGVVGGGIVGLGQSLGTIVETTFTDRSPCEWGRCKSGGSIVEQSVEQIEIGGVDVSTNRMHTKCASQTQRISGRIDKTIQCGIVALIHADAENADHATHTRSLKHGVNVGVEFSPVQMCMAIDQWCINRFFIVDQLVRQRRVSD